MDIKAKLYPSNPLGIIATFVFFIEAISASTIFAIKEYPCILNKVIWFIIIFPSSIAFLFFLILVLKREILFAPSDFKDENNFINLLNRLDKLEIGQKVNQYTANPPTNLDNVFNLVDDLIKNGEYKNVVRIGRGYLKLNEFGKSKKFFEHVKHKTPKSEDFYYTILSNVAYSKIGLKEFGSALEDLLEVKSIRGGDKLEVWHLAALCYTLKNLGRTAEFNEFLIKCHNHPKFNSEKDIFKNIYNDVPEIWNVN